jgi:hypothetical protein
MLGHRVNSEGLRGRANAPRRRRTQEDLYRVWLRLLSTFPRTNTRKKPAKIAGFCKCRCDAPNAQGRGLPTNSRLSVPTPYCGHIPRPILIIRRVSRTGGKRQHHLSFLHLAVRVPGTPCAGGFAGRGVWRLARDRLLGEVAVRGIVAQGHLGATVMKGTSAQGKTFAEGDFGRSETLIGRRGRGSGLGPGETTRR